VVFGEIGTRPHGTVDEVRRLLPTGLMSALSFAAGNGIRAPWCELRTFRGDLVRRLHVRAGMNPQAGGFPSFSRFDSARSGSGIGAFLNCYFSLSFDRRLSLIAPMNLIRSGTPGDATVDESIADLMKALDAVCKINDVTRQSLTLKLDSGCSKVVAEILEGAREKLKYLRRECVTDGRLDQLCVLDRIISRQANVAGEERDFGIAFAELLQKLRLFDFDAMNAYYSQLSKPLTWESLISFVRGQVIHSGAIDMGGTGEILRWFEFLRHLHDICKRVLLREVGYQGTYAATNVTYTGQYEIDRVKPSMQLRELGYSAAPITI